jgi:hypothetical protein
MQVPIKTRQVLFAPRKVDTKTATKADQQKHVVQHPTQMKHKQIKENKQQSRFIAMEATK